MQSVNRVKKQYQLSLLSKTQQGYTLLEVMLAIVIIATITVFSISIFQQQAVNSQIDKTALQMQQWLEAAKAYYVDNGNWPDGNNFTGEGTGLSCTGQTIDPSILLLEGKCGPLAENNKIYIQSGTGIENNAWGQTFQLLPPAGQTTENSAMFQVVSNIPGNLKNAYAIAERLASRLPNAVVNMMVLNKPITVSAGVTIPGSASDNTNNVIIEAIADIDCSDSSGHCTVPPKPNCPQGYLPAIHVAVKSFYSTGGKANAQAIGFLDSLPSNYKLNDPWPTPDLQVYGPRGQLTHNGELLAITTCEKPSTNGQTNTHSNFTY